MLSSRTFIPIEAILAGLNYVAMGLSFNAGAKIMQA